MTILTSILNGSTGKDVRDTLNALLANVLTLLPRKTVINTYTASGTVVAGDAEAFVRMNAAAANTYTVPTNATLALAIGTQIDVQQVGAGQTTFVAASGVVFQSDSAYVKLKGQYAVATLVKVDTDVWALVGALVA